MLQKSARDAAGTAWPRPRTASTGAHQVTKRRSAQGEQSSVQEYLDRFATALTSGDPNTMSKLWGVPAFVVGDNEARVVQSESEIEEFFGNSKDLYNERGIVGARAEIANLDWIGQDLVIATVTWLYLDGNDRVLCEESSSYTLLRGENRSFKLRVLTMRGAGEPDADEGKPIGAGDRRDGTDGE